MNHINFANNILLAVLEEIDNEVNILLRKSPTRVLLVDRRVLLMWDLLQVSRP